MGVEIPPTTICELSRHEARLSLSVCTSDTTQDETSISIRIEPKQADGTTRRAELTTYRAELVILQRKTLEQLAGRRGWYFGWSYHSRGQRSWKESRSSGDTMKRANALASASDVPSPSLTTVLNSEEIVQRPLYEESTFPAVQHYLAASDPEEERRETDGRPCCA
jgi:hypothetical protein